jgi:flagellar basal-body rod modification protein FlgD
MSAIPPTSATGNQLSGSTSVSNPNALLDKDGFLKMLVAQMQNQDPSSPMDAAQQTEQMAAFTEVEQITNMSQGMTQSSAVGLIGHTVTYKDSTGAAQSGLVQSVDTSDPSSPTLTVAGHAGVDPTSITQVA